MTTGLPATLLNIALVIFMAGNLLDMGLRLNPQDALRGLRNVRFVAYTLLWGFVIGPVLACAIAMVMPLAAPNAMGLILLGMTPGAPFLPMIVSKAHGDLGYTAAFMLLTAVGTVLFMPLAVPVLVRGLTVSAWHIAEPLLFVIFLPLAVGMAVLRARPAVASRVQPYVKTITGLATLATCVLCAMVYGKGLLGVPGSLALAAQLVFFFVLTAFSYWFGFGLPQEQKVVLSAGMATRNLGAAFAPLLSVADTDQRAIVMVVLALPVTVLFALLAAKWFGRVPSATGTGPRNGRGAGVGP
jgi:bile acid:Na+ symporter, BASS family